MLYKTSLSFTATTHIAGSTKWVRTGYLQGYLKAICYRPTTGAHYSTAKVIQITRDQSTAAFKSSAGYLVLKFLPSSTKLWFYPTVKRNGSSGGVLNSTAGYADVPLINEKFLICLQPTSSGAGTTGHTQGTLDFIVDGAPGLAGST